MGPPRALIISLTLFGIESISLLIVSGVYSLQTLQNYFYGFDGFWHEGIEY
jgi:hypothetical protein